MCLWQLHPFKRGDHTPTNLDNQQFKFCQVSELYPECVIACWDALVFFLLFLGDTISDTVNLQMIIYHFSRS